MDLIIPVLIGIAVLSFLVFVHEAGHFLAAKLFGVKVEEFGFGFPFPGKIWSVKKGETTYSINWLPAGGFVKLYGEESGSARGPRAFTSKPVGVRIIIAAAGVIVNIALAVILFTILLGASRFKADFDLQIPNQFPFGKQTNYVLITGVEEGSPAQMAGLKFGDKILSHDGQRVNFVEDLQDLVEVNKGKPLSLLVENIKEDNQLRVVNAVPRIDPPEGQGALGLGLAQGATVAYESFAERLFSGVLHSGNMLQYQWVGMKTIFGKAFEQGSLEPIASQSSGPVGIVAVLGVIVQNAGTESVRILLTLTAFISLVLGVVNILPIPAMDGGRLFFFALEAVRGKKVSPKVENLVHSIGFVVLIFLFLLITFNDVVKIFTGRIF